MQTIDTSFDLRIGSTIIQPQANLDKIKTCVNILEKLGDILQKLGHIPSIILHVAMVGVNPPECNQTSDSRFSRRTLAQYRCYRLTTFHDLSAYLG